MTDYIGPLRDEPLAVELHNTLYVAGGAWVDGLSDPAQASAWLREIDRRLPLGDPPPSGRPSVSKLVELRGAVRTALHGALENTPADPAALAAINRASARATSSPAAVQEPSGAVVKRIDHHGAAFGDLVLAEFARDAIDLLTGTQRTSLRACGAPGCILLFVRDHPRREWCSNACGNRARQARHYRRVRNGEVP
jgi:predicted RNA-binding Zn ribbon-like protein